MGRVWKKRNRRVVFSHRSCPTKSFILSLFAGKRVLIHKYFGTFPHNALTLAEVELVLQQRYPGIGTGAANENVIVVIEVAHSQIPRVTDQHLRLQSAC